MNPWSTITNMRMTCTTSMSIRTPCRLARAIRIFISTNQSPIPIRIFRMRTTITTTDSDFASTVRKIYKADLGWRDLK